jgi:hypothetical protein
VHARPVVYLINLLSFGVLETPALYTRCNNGIRKYAWFWSGESGDNELKSRYATINSFGKTETVVQTTSGAIMDKSCISTTSKVLLDLIDCWRRKKN